MTVPITSPIQIDFDILTKVVEGGVLLTGAWFALKSQVKTLYANQIAMQKELRESRAESKAADTEQLRQLKALHERLDREARKIQKLDKQNAVIWDRLNRTTQRVQPLPQEGNPFTDGWTPEEEPPE